MLYADALAIVSEDQSEVHVGGELQAIVLDDHRHVESCPW